MESDRASSEVSSVTSGHDSTIDFEVDTAAYKFEKNCVVCGKEFGSGLRRPKKFFW
jgi:hypothetical protein